MRILKAVWWTVKLMYLTGYRPKEVYDVYTCLLFQLGERAEKEKAIEYWIGTHTIRLAGATLVIDEKYAINPLKAGVFYVHYRLKPTDSWEKVYHTYELSNDFSFIETLFTCARLVHFAVPVPSVENNTGNAASETVVN